MSSTTIYTDQTKKTKPSFKEIEVPPRKLLVKKNHRHCDPSMMFFPEDITTLHKFLPFNNTDADSDPDSDPYASDHFRIYEFKIRRCTRSRSHDWTDCPFAHPGEKARRRDPRRFHYSGTVCSEYRRAGTCSRGDDCEFAHGVFECWLHPSRYRTEACKDGKNCKRKVCFFAHSPRQLRILPEISTSSPKYSKTQTQQHHHHCCMYCHGSINSSPTSTLLNMSQFSRSPSLSPPLSPVKHNFSPISSHRFTKLNNSESLTYKDVLNELISSLDNINLNLSFNDAVSISSPSPSPSPSTSTTSPWLDVIDHHHNHTHQPQFVPSPSTPSPSATSLNYFANNSADPDLGWVNDLLM